MEVPFEEVLEKAKAGDPKAQTEVRTACREAQPAAPAQWPQERPVPCERGAGLPGSRL